jgi:tetratricopeptide (TPR) repeat protein
VISNSGERQARQIANQFERFRAVIRKALPRLEVDPSTPIVIFAVKSEDDLESLLPALWKEKGTRNLPGLFISGPEKNYILLRTDIREEFRFETVYHEYVHLLMRLNLPPLPTWLNEGLAEFFGHAIISEKTSHLGRASTRQLAILKNERHLSLEELFAVDHDSPHYRKQEEASIFYAQSWALTHFLMLGERGKNFDKLAAYVTYLERNMPESQAATRAFGSLEALEEQLRSYIRQFSFYYMEVDTPSLDEIVIESPRKVPPSEMLARRGEVFIKTNAPKVAQETLERALEQNPRSIQIHESLGQIYRKQNALERAALHLDTAIDLGSRSSITYYTSAMIARSLGRSGDIEKAEKYLRTAIQLDPQFTPAYKELIGILTSYHSNLDEALNLAQEAVRVEPGSVRNHLTLAGVLEQMMRMEEALKIAATVRGLAKTSNDRIAVEHFISSTREKWDKLVEEGVNISDEAAKIADHRPFIEERDRIYGDGKKAWEQKEKDYLEKVLSASPETAALEGHIVEIKCLYPTIMELTFNTNGEVQKLHSANYFKIQYWARDIEMKEDMQPCRDLEGHRARIEFIPTPDAQYAGEIQTIEIHK